jgi:uncharacterized protein DUF4386
MTQAIYKPVEIELQSHPVLPGSYEMVEWFAEASPRLKARIAGALYLFSLLTVAFGELSLHGRWAIAAGLVGVSGMVAMTMLLYDIFRPVNRGLSLLAAFFSLVGLTFEALRSQPRGMNVAVVFAGLYCILTGYLIFRSTFLPRILGVLIAIAGLGWLTFLSTPFANRLSPYDVASGVLGEGSVMLWLLVMGVNVQRWKEQERIAEASPRPRARITGVVYLLYFLTAVSAEVFVGQGRFVAYDAVNLVAYAFYIAVTLLFFHMFRPVNRSLSLLAAFFSLVGCANDVLGLFNLAPYKISSLVFFGPYCILIGYLIFRSTFLPRILGVLLAIAGLGWLIVLSPAANHLSTYLKVLGFLAEASLMLWLVVKGVNVQRWKEQAIAAVRVTNHVE